MLGPSNRMSPSMRVPSTRSLSRLKQRNNVDFPHPDGPMNAVIFLLGISRLTSKSACFDPYHSDSDSTQRIGFSILGWSAGSAAAGLFGGATVSWGCTSVIRFVLVVLKILGIVSDAS